MRKLSVLILLATLMGMVATSRAQQPGGAFNATTCTAGICCAVPLPQMTYVPPPAPGAQPSATVTSGPAPVLYKIHVSNAAVTTGYVQLFNLAATPAAAVTPVGASSWSIATVTDRDITLGEMMGLGGFTNGAQVCCSSTQGVFTGQTGCGFIIEWR
jgi:hypothetical protein